MHHHHHHALRKRPTARQTESKGCRRRVTRKQSRVAAQQRPWGAFLFGHHDDGANGYANRRPDPHVDLQLITRAFWFGGQLITLPDADKEKAVELSWADCAWGSGRGFGFVV